MAHFAGLDVSVKETAVDDAGGEPGGGEMHNCVRRLGALA